MAKGRITLASEMSHSHYLTVQDILWTNLQVTKKVNHYQFAKLEEATFCQYAIGSQPSIEIQASRLLSGILRLKPFDIANEATALVGCEAFLNLNGRELNVNDEKASSWIESILDGRKTALKAIEEVISDSTENVVGDVKKAIQTAVLKFECTVQQLVDRSKKCPA